MIPRRIITITIISTVTKGIMTRRRITITQNHIKTTMITRSIMTITKSIMAIISSIIMIKRKIIKALEVRNMKMIRKVTNTTTT